MCCIIFAATQYYRYSIKIFTQRTYFLTESPTTTTRSNQKIDKETLEGEGNKTYALPLPTHGFVICTLSYKYLLMLNYILSASYPLITQCQQQPLQP